MHLYSFNSGICRFAHCKKQPPNGKKAISDSMLTRVMRSNKKGIWGTKVTADIFFTEPCEVAVGGFGALALAVEFYRTANKPADRKGRNATS